VKFESRKKDSNSEFVTILELPIKNLYGAEVKFQNKDDKK